MRLRKFIVRLDVFDFEFVCLIGPTSLAAKFCKKYFLCDTIGGKEIESGFVGYGAVLRVGSASVLWLPRHPRTIKEHGTLAHEAAHVVTILMATMGMPLNYDTQETFCHALGHAVETILGSGDRK